MKKRALLTFILVVGTGLALIPQSSRANGKPVSLYVTWLPGVTNWTNGQHASGTALVSVSLGEIKLDIHSLPHLPTGQYEAWLVSEDMMQKESMGRFNSDMTGRAKYEHTREDLPALEYRFLLISVEPEPDPSPASSGQWATGAVFPDTALLVVTATPPSPAGSQGTPSGTPGAGAGSVSATPTPPAPQILPTTGGSLPDLPAAIFFALGLIVMGCGIIWKQRRLPI